MVTRRGNDMRLYLDGGLQFSTRDEYRYTESLVYPALGAGARSVLVLGGGDGLAARELLRSPGVDNIVQVELDPAVIELARSTMRSANGGSLDNPRVHIVTGDAMTWLRGAKAPSFDAVIVDLPDPDTPVLGRLYSTEFYALVSARAHAQRVDGGAVGKPVFDPNCVLAHGFHHHRRRLRGHAVSRVRPDLRRLGIRAGAPGRQGAAIHRCRPTRLRCDSSTSRCSRPQRYSRPMCNRRTLEPSTLEHPRIVEDMRHGYD